MRGKYAEIMTVIVNMRMKYADMGYISNRLMHLQKGKISIFEIPGKKI